MTKEEQAISEAKDFPVAGRMPQAFLCLVQPPQNLVRGPLADRLVQALIHLWDCLLDKQNVCRALWLDATIKQPELVALSTGSLSLTREF